MKRRRKINRLAAASLIAAPVAFCLTTSAQASPIANPISAQVGAGFLVNNDARDVSANTGIHAGLAMRLPNKSLLSPNMGQPSIDADYNRATGHGGHVEVLGFTYTERISLTPAVSTPVGNAAPRTYVGLGIGLYRNDVRIAPNATAPAGGGGGGGGGGTSGLPGAVAHAVARSTTSQSKTNWQVGGKVLAGIDFGKTFVEAAYQIGGSTLGVRTDCVDLSIGMHF